MPRLLQAMLHRVYQNPEPGDTGGGGAAIEPTEAQLSLLQSDHGLTIEEFKDLRPEDQAALLADTPDDTRSLTPEPAPSPPPSPEPTAPPAATPAPSAPPAATPAPSAPPAATPAPPAPAAPAAPAASPAPHGGWRADQPIELPQVIAPVQVALPDDAAKKTDIDGKLDALFDKFAEGELSKEDYQKQKRELEGSLTEINGRIAGQAAVDAQARASAIQAWGTMVEQSMAIAKAAGMDYSAPENKAMSDELDAAVKRFAQAAPLMHPTQSGTWLDRWALVEAHKEVAAKHGKTFAMPGAAASPGPAPAPAGQRAAPDLSKLPPTLSGAPEAASAHVTDDEFAAVDRMDPIEAEKAVARFDEATMARYLAR